MKEKSDDGWKIACVIGLFALKISLLYAKMVEKWNWILFHKIRRMREWKHTSRNL